MVFRMVEEPQKSIDEPDEQERGDGRALSRSCVHEDIICLFLTDADPHRWLV